MAEIGAVHFITAAIQSNLLILQAKLANSLMPGKSPQETGRAQARA